MLDDCRTSSGTHYVFSATALLPWLERGVSLLEVADVNTSYTYPEPHISSQSWDELRRDIEADGLEEDRILQTNPDGAVFGINLAFCWPLPAALKVAYERAAKALSQLDSGLYVYPYPETHVTVMTLVNFKLHLSPTVGEVRSFLQDVPRIVSCIAPFVSRLKPFVIDVGPPVASRRAVFLPILNPTQEVLSLRELAASATKEIGLLECIAPKAIHSTIARFLRRPDDSKEFLSRFQSSVTGLGLGRTTVDSFLLTSETRPYMRAGEILHRFTLAG